MNKEQLKGHFNWLVQIVGVFDEFNDLDLDTNRKKLFVAINDMKDCGWIRKDENNVVRLWSNKTYYNNGLRADVEIGITNDRKICVCTDGLWKTLKALDERIYEY